jgi:hypothetical protein
MCNPFAYPSEPHARRHGPAGYLSYPSFKPWLRDEFAFRCVYCLFRERWYPSGQDSFSVEHITPRSVAPERECDYENLVYACLRCNSWKRDTLLPDPCASGYGQSLHVREDGTVEAMAEEGNRLIDTLFLNGRSQVDFRRRLLAALRLLQSRRRSGLAEWLGFPLDLPDLSLLRPPGGNTRPGGIAGSWFARWQRRDLPATY